MKKLLAVFIFALFALGAGNSRAEWPCDDPETPPGYIFPDPDDCTRFIVCVGDLAYYGQCPPGTVFYPALQQCDFPGKPGDPCGEGINL